MRNVLQPSRMYQHDRNSINYNIFPNNVWRGLNNPDVPSLSCPLSLSLLLCGGCVCLTRHSGLEHKVLRECAVCFGRWRDLQKDG